ncbi:hypothetical protein [Paenibacillus dendritiformis]|uniref:hypothetical protein n=1 Tax=Paenibacillus dendritiformis TaxID=130049 RepID=UPI001BD04BED|nr:hypothetical protein [Paenibacillus dendritiformis]
MTFPSRPGLADVQEIVGTRIELQIEAPLSIAIGSNGQEEKIELTDEQAGIAAAMPQTACMRRKGETKKWAIKPSLPMHCRITRYNRQL